MENRPYIQFLRLNPNENSDIPLPRYMTHLSAGMDLYSANKSDTILKPGAIKLIPTGFAIAIPEGFEAQIRPRSGLAAKHGIGLINSPGTIDADYRGEVMIALINLSDKDYLIHRKDRIAQMVIQKVYQGQVTLVEKLSKTHRNDGGFGHTGR